MQIDPSPAQVAATLAAITEALDLITAEIWQRADNGAAGLRLMSVRDGAVLQLRYNAQLHRFAISGSLWLCVPEQPSVNLADHLGQRPARLSYTITASADKPAPAIAREIARRLLPDYRAARTQALTRYEEQQRRRWRCEQIAAELAAIVCGETCPDRRERTEFYDGMPGIHVKGHVNSPESVQIEIRYIDADTARAELRVIADRA
jgi:hypothetical protein